MTTKKILGYVFIVIAVLLFIAIVGQLPKLLAAIFGFFKIFTGELDGYQVGRVIGSIVVWILHFGITISLWVVGRRWIKTQFVAKER